MKNRIFGPLSFLSVLGLVGTAQAQPFSESMADCAAQMQNAAQWVQSQDKSDALIYAARQWADAAQAQAEAEGASLSDSQLWTKIDGKTEVIEEKGMAYFLTQDWRDWASYCRKFAKSRGIKIQAETSS